MWLVSPIREICENFQSETWEIIKYLNWPIFIKLYYSTLNFKIFLKRVPVLTGSSCDTQFAYADFIHPNFPWFFFQSNVMEYKTHVWVYNLNEIFLNQDLETLAKDAVPVDIKLGRDLKMSEPLGELLDSLM